MARKETTAGLMGMHEAVSVLTTDMENALLKVLGDASANRFDKLTAIRVFVYNEARIHRAVHAIYRAHADCVNGGERS
jgi:hypothetical protein